MRFKIRLFLIVSVFLQINLYSQKLTFIGEDKTLTDEELMIYTYDQAFFDYKSTIVSFNPKIENPLILNLEKSDHARDQKEGLLVIQDFYW